MKCSPSFPSSEPTPQSQEERADSGEVSEGAEYSSDTDHALQETTEGTDNEADNTLESLDTIENEEVAPDTIENEEVAPEETEDNEDTQPVPVVEQPAADAEPVAEAVAEPVAEAVSDVTPVESATLVESTVESVPIPEPVTEPVSEAEPEPPTPRHISPTPSQASMSSIFSRKSKKSLKDRLKSSISLVKSKMGSSASLKSQASHESLKSHHSTSSLIGIVYFKV